MSHGEKRTLCPVFQHVTIQLHWWDANKVNQMERLVQYSNIVYPLNNVYNITSRIRLCFR